jgi:hypothetical protein
MKSSVRVQGWTSCTVCQNKKKEQIDKMLLDNKTLAQISEKFGISPGSLSRHRTKHLMPLFKQVAEKNKEIRLEKTEKIVAAIETQELKYGNALVDKVWGIYNRADAILTREEKRKKSLIALAAMREMRETLKLIANMLGELKGDSPTINVNIINNPQWLQIKEVTLQVLSEYEGASSKLLNALSRLEGSE